MVSLILFFVLVRVVVRIRLDFEDGGGFAYHDEMSKD